MLEYKNDIRINQTTLEIYELAPPNAAGIFIAPPPPIQLVGAPPPPTQITRRAAADKIQSAQGSSQDRLGSLALIHIHYNTDIDLNEVIDVFAKKHARRMLLNCVLADGLTD